MASGVTHRRSGDGLHRPGRRRSAPTRSFIRTSISKGAPRSARAARSNAGVRIVNSTLDDGVFVNSYCVITDSHIERGARARAVRAPPAGVARRRGRARRQLRRAEEDHARARVEGQPPRLSRRRDDRREGQRRRRHDHLQLRRQEEASDDDRGRRVHRQRLAADRAGHASARAPTSPPARRSPRTSRPARSPSRAASRSTKRAGSDEEARVEIHHVRNHRLHRLEAARSDPDRRPAPPRVSRLRLGRRRGRPRRLHRAAAQRRQAGAARRSDRRPIRSRANTGSATRAGPRTAGRPKRTRIRTATAPAASSSSTTASSRTTSS